MQLRAFILFVSTAAALSSCFLMPREKTAKKIGAKSRILNRNSIYFDRVGDGKSARIRFKTNRPANCELSFYSQTEGGTPNRKKPGRKKCSNSETDQTSFEEKITDLSTEHLYFVVLKIWDAKNKKEKPEVVTVKEAGGNSGGNPAETVDEPNPSSDGDDNPNTVIDPAPIPIEDKLSELFVARFNIPLRMAEVHKHKLQKPLSLSELKQQLTLGSGCREGFPDSKSLPFREAVNTLDLEGLTTQDFAAATAQPHPTAPGRLQLQFNGLNEGLDKWTFLYKLGGQDFNVPVRPISRIVSMDMESDDITTVESTQLTDAVDPLKINPSKPLKFKWTTGSSLSELTFMTIQISRAEDPKAIYCVFPAEQRSGTVDPKFLKELDDGRHVVLAQLTTSQVWFKYNWIISTYDWRSSRIEK